MTDLNKQVQQIDARLEKLETFRERVATLEGRLQGTDHFQKRWHSMILAIGVAALVGVLGWGARELYTHNSKLARIEQDISDIRQLLLPERLKQLADDPADADNIREVRNLLTAARERKISIPVEIIKRVGHVYIQAATKYPPAWDAAVALINYRSFSNARDARTPSNLERIAPDQVAYRFTLSFTEPPLNPPESGLWVSVFTFGKASPGQSALLDSLARPQSATPQVELIFVEGFGRGISLENARMKNVVIRNARIRYSGGPVWLENVQFIDCTFIMQRTQNSEQLGTALLETSSINYKAA